MPAGQHLRESSLFGAGFICAFIRNKNGHGLAAVGHHHAVAAADPCDVAREPIAKAPDADGTFQADPFCCHNSVTMIKSGRIPVKLHRTQAP